jgi:uncharacterized protein (DUF983 family)
MPEPSTASRSRKPTEVLGRAIRKRCPACGGSPIFETPYELREVCPACGLEIRAREPDTWFFMYVSTAGITGAFLFLAVFLIPPSWTPGRILTILSAIALFFGTIRVRKSLAIAIDYLF